MKKVRWGVLGAAKIAVEKVIPAMQRGQANAMVAIGSRSLERARETARRLELPKAYGSYDELLADPEIDAIYNPLPNHEHIAWSVKALEAGKHVLTEKPLALAAADARPLLEASRKRPQLKLMEAFMYRHHPQWVTARKLAHGGDIGDLRSIQTFFSFFNRDPGNYRNNPQQGGGALMDIGCYPISLSRWIFDREPNRVLGLIDRDPEMGIDRLVSGVLDFGAVNSTFTASTQTTPFQRVNIYGTRGQVEVEIPFNAPNDRPCRIFLENESGRREILFPVCDQYTIQGELFARAVLDDKPVPTPIEDGVANMAVIDAIFRSAETNQWVQPELIA